MYMQYHVCNVHVVTPLQALLARVVPLLAVKTGIRCERPLNKLVSLGIGDHGMGELEAGNKDH